MAINDEVDKYKFIETATHVKERPPHDFFARGAAGGYGAWTFLWTKEAEDLVDLNDADEIVLTALKHYRSIQYNHAKVEYYTPSLNALLRAYVNSDVKEFKSAVLDYIERILAD